MKTNFNSELVKVNRLYKNFDLDVVSYLALRGMKKNNSKHWKRN